MAVEFQDFLKSENLSENDGQALLLLLEKCWNTAVRSCSEEFKEELIKVGTDASVKGYISALETISQMSLEIRKQVLDKQLGVPDDPA